MKKVCANTKEKASDREALMAERLALRYN